MHSTTRPSPSEQRHDRHRYVQRVLELYAATPTVLGYVRTADRRLAARLYDRGIPLEVVRTAFVYAAVRRLFRPYDAPPLPLVRSLHFFLPVIQEVFAEPLPAGYVWCLQFKLRHLHLYGIKAPPKPPALL